MQHIHNPATSERPVARDISSAPASRKTLSGLWSSMREVFCCIPNINRKRPLRRIVKRIRLDEPSQSPSSPQTDFSLDEDAAVLLIQRHIRGYLGRKRATEYYAATLREIEAYWKRVQDGIDARNAYARALRSSVQLVCIDI